jgi:hypothetical protein
LSSGTTGRMNIKDPSRSLTPASGTPASGTAASFKMPGVGFEPTRRFGSGV